MTRGQIAIITGEDEIYTSIEFNGDMYMPDGQWEGHGQEVIDRLKRVNDTITHSKEVKEFNEANFQYPERPLVYYHNGDKMLDMREETYFDKWFSDYVYLKNLTDTTKTITDYDGNEFTIEPNQIAVICFGKLELMAE